MNDKEQRKLRLELQRVRLAKSTMEDSMEDMKEEIGRVLGHIAVQDAKEQELINKLKEFEGN